jgi:hypothetical protein
MLVWLLPNSVGQFALAGERRRDRTIEIEIEISVRQLPLEEVNVKA